jgi:hypothetical protein
MLKSGTQKFLRQISSGKQALIATFMQINAFLSFKQECNVPYKKRPDIRPVFLSKYGFEIL